MQSDHAVAVPRPPLHENDDEEMMRENSDSMADSGQIQEHHDLLRDEASLADTPLFKKGKAEAEIKDVLRDKGSRTARYSRKHVTRTSATSAVAAVASLDFSSSPIPTVQPAASMKKNVTDADTTLVNDNDEDDDSAAELNQFAKIVKIASARKIKDQRDVVVAKKTTRVDKRALEMLRTRLEQKPQEQEEQEEGFAEAVPRQATKNQKIAQVRVGRGASESKTRRAVPEKSMSLPNTAQMHS